MQRKKVFISYAREDSAAALKLYKDLTLEGLDVWIDKECLLPGQNWEKAIRTAITNSDYFIPLLSSNSVNKRGMVQKEVRLALGVAEEFPEGLIFIIPVRLDPCDTSFTSLQKLHRVDIFLDYHLGLQDILRVLLYDPNKKEKGSLLKRRLIGRIERIYDRGFGFISYQLAEKDLFFHVNSVEMDFDSLSKGDWVLFDMFEGAKGPFASSVGYEENDHRFANGKYIGG